MIPALFFIFNLLIGAPAAAMPEGGALATAFSTARQALQSSRRDVGFLQEVPEPWGRSQRVLCDPAFLPAGMWRGIFGKACAKGEYRPVSGEIPAIYVLESIRGLQAKDHQADYVTLWGGVDADGTFIPDNASLVSENWVIEEDGNWHIDQWIFTMGLDGVIDRVSHSVLVEAPDRLILDRISKPSAPGDPSVKEKLDALFVFWTKFSS
jgi:hypothetical protein